MSNATLKKTCQICGRLIGCKTGYIAHHGYTRPYQYMQTSSCEGAKELPYEESCDVLKVVIERVKAFVMETERRLEDFTENPPILLTQMERRSSWSRPEEKIFNRPADFDLESRHTQYWFCMPNTYENAYSNKKYDFEQTIKMAKSDLSIMERRLNNWKAPVNVGGE